MNEAGKSAWCREHGVYPSELDKWRASCTTALTEKAALLVLSKKVEAIFNKGEDG